MMKQSTETENVSLGMPKYIDIGQFIIRLDSILSIDKDNRKMWTTETKTGSSSYYTLSEETLNTIIKLLGEQHEIICVGN